MTTVGTLPTGLELSSTTRKDLSTIITQIYTTSFSADDNFTSGLDNVTNTTVGSPIDDDLDEYRITRILLAALCIVIIIVAVVGNVIVICAILRTAYLRRLNNYLIVSLSLADLGTAVLCLPFFVMELFYNYHWPLPHVVCALYASTEISFGLLSVFTLAAISCERVFLITKPMVYQRIVTELRLIAFIIILWAFCFCYGFLQMAWFYTDWYQESVRENPNQCRYLPTREYTIFAFIIAFILPLGVMLVAYLKIFCVVRGQIQRIRPRLHSATDDGFSEEVSTPFTDRARSDRNQSIGGLPNIRSQENSFDRTEAKEEQEDNKPKVVLVVDDIGEDVMRIIKCSEDSDKIKVDENAEDTLRYTNTEALDCNQVSSSDIPSINTDTPDHKGRKRHGSSSSSNGRGPVRTGSEAIATGRTDAQSPICNPIPSLGTSQYSQHAGDNNNEGTKPDIGPWEHVNDQLTSSIAITDSKLLESQISSTMAEELRDTTSRVSTTQAHTDTVTVSETNAEICIVRSTTPLQLPAQCTSHTQLDESNLINSPTTEQLMLTRSPNTAGRGPGCTHGTTHSGEASAVDRDAVISEILLSTGNVVVEGAQGTKSISPDPLIADQESDHIEIVTPCSEVIGINSPVTSAESKSGRSETVINPNRESIVMSPYRESIVSTVGVTNRLDAELGDSNLVSPTPTNEIHDNMSPTRSRASSISRTKSTPSKTPEGLRRTSTPKCSILKNFIRIASPIPPTPEPNVIRISVSPADPSKTLEDNDLQSKEQSEIIQCIDLTTTDSTQSLNLYNNNENKLLLDAYPEGRMRSSSCNEVLTHVQGTSSGLSSSRRDTPVRRVSSATELPLLDKLRCLKNEPLRLHSVLKKPNSTKSIDQCGYPLGQKRNSVQFKLYDVSILEAGTGGDQALRAVLVDDETTGSSEGNTTETSVSSTHPQKTAAQKDSTSNTEQADDTASLEGTPSHRHTLQWAKKHFNINQSAFMTSTPSLSRMPSVSMSEGGFSRWSRRRSRLFENKAVRMTSYVIGAFVVCWVPYQVSMMLRLFAPQLVPDILWNITTVIMFMSTAVNPFIYNFYSSQFRAATRKLLKCQANVIHPE